MQKAWKARFCSTIGLIASQNSHQLFFYIDSTPKIMLDKCLSLKCNKYLIMYAWVVGWWQVLAFSLHTRKEQENVLELNVTLRSRSLTLTSSKRNEERKFFLYQHSVSDEEALTPTHHKSLIGHVIFFQLLVKENENLCLISFQYFCIFCSLLQCKFGDW